MKSIQMSGMPKRTHGRGTKSMSRNAWLLSGMFFLSLGSSAMANEDYGISDRPQKFDVVDSVRLEARTWPATVDAAGLAENELEIVSEDAIRQSLAQKLKSWDARLTSSRSLGVIQKDITNFYSERYFRPLWISEGKWSSQGIKLINILDRADEDGLASSDYSIPRIDPAGSNPDELAAADLSLSLAIIGYARDARGARVDLARLSKLITPKLELPDTQTVLGDLVTSSDPGSALAAYNPQHPGYLALKAKLAQFREYTASIAPAPVSEPSANVSPQKSSNPRPPSISEIIANMERWRWLPRDLGSERIEVNLPEFTARVIRRNQIVHQTRVIIGKQTTPTPLFSNQMVHLIVNPSWHVPPSIIKKEILPKLVEDPEYAVRNGYEVTELGSGGVSVRQPPGQGNALGLVKFMFPNEHSVYLHDTPSRKLFANEERAYSHGCVRVQNPFELAAILLDDPQYSEDKLKAMIGKGERLIRLKAPVPIHLTYFTLLVNENGEIQRISDVYGYDKPLEQALKASPSRALAALRQTGG